VRLAFAASPGALAVVLALVAGPSRAEERAGSLGPSVLQAPVEQRFSEQGILTPVPIRVAAPAGLRAHRVLVHYRLFGEPEWTTLELSRLAESSWSGAIPCLQVSTVTGDLVYYVRFHDAEGRVIAYSGSRHRPYRVRIVHPTLRADLPMGRCPDPADCPAGLPGCPSEVKLRAPCSSDADCEGGRTCGWDGFCESRSRARDWLSLELEQDVGFVATTGACTVAAQESEGYACFREDGSRYRGNPVLSNEPIRVGLGPTRVVLGYERVFFYGSTVGVRAAYALRGGGPDLPEGIGFLPVSLDARLAHWLGRDPFARGGVRVFVFATAGFGMFDVEVPVHVRENPELRSGQGGNDLEQDLTAWKRAGDVFVGAGAGGLLPLGRDVHAPAVSAELGALQVFPFGLTVIAPRAGLRVPF
jgi:hypothetical protein